MEVGEGLLQKYDDDVSERQESQTATKIFSVHLLLVLIEVLLRETALELKEEHKQQMLLQCHSTLGSGVSIRDRGDEPLSPNLERLQSLVWCWDAK